MKALEIDGATAETHRSTAFVKRYHDWEWEDAEREFKRAVELSPGDAFSHLWGARHLVCRARTDEPLREMKRALEPDPLPPIMNTTARLIFSFDRQYDKAAEALQRTIETDPNLIAARLYLRGGIRVKQCREVPVKCYPLPGQGLMHFLPFN
ncbi:MAG: hypothetical protein JSV16_15750 [Candidatus Hydrogenedentota bacterium]|nr:MAG: hypothetical protein JSV16_15750 [Candidatus Hydrogenedentota bacterium]